MAIQTVLVVLMLVVTTANVALWAFRPNAYGTRPGLRRILGIATVVWAVFLAAAAALLLVLGGWQADVQGAVALACWPVTLLALRRRRLAFRTH